MNVQNVLAVGLQVMRGLVGVGVTVVLLTGPRQVAAAPATNALVEVQIPKSVFTVPANPSEGRNPFFPRSAAATPAPSKAVATEQAPDLTGLVLQGIIPVGARRNVMINGITLEEGDEHEIRLPSGERVQVKCVQIKETSVVVLVGKQTRELRIRSL
jgi:hypothetical protein